MEVSFITYNINYYFLDSERVSEKKTRECKLQGLVLMSTRIILIMVLIVILVITVMVPNQ